MKWCPSLSPHPPQASPSSASEAPDPRGLSINGKPLREHLQQAGLTTPLKLHPLLQSLSFADFEAHYRAGGRLPYAPQAMVGLILYGILAATEQRGIELLCPEGQSLGEDWNKQSDKHIPKSRFMYQADDDSYRCPNQQRLTPRHTCSGGKSGRAYTLYACDACTDCPLKNQCTRGEGGRTLKRYASDTQKDALRLKMTQPEHRQRYRQRQAMVEPVFSQLRGRQGLNRFRRKGSAGVKVEFALHAMAYNLGRALVLAFFSALHQWLRWSESAFEWIFGFWPLFVTRLGFRLAEENRAGF